MFTISKLLHFCFYILTKKINKPVKLKNNHHTKYYWLLYFESSFSASKCIWQFFVSHHTEHMSAKMHSNFLLPISICFLKKKLYLIDVCFGCNWFVSLDKLIFFVNYVYCVPASRVSVMNDEIILYWVTTDTNLHTLSKLLNHLSFENILNC